MGLKFSVCNFIFTFPDPQHVSRSLKKYSSFLIFVWPILIFLKKIFKLSRLIHLAVNFGPAYYLQNLPWKIAVYVLSILPECDCRVIHSVHLTIIICFCFILW